jgi:hypothetical protein
MFVSKATLVAFFCGKRDSPILVDTKTEAVTLVQPKGAHKKSEASWFLVYQADADKESGAAAQQG